MHARVRPFPAGSEAPAVRSRAPFEGGVTPDLLKLGAGAKVDIGSFARRRGFAVSLDDAGTRTTGVIRCDRPRVLDLAARNGKRVEAVPEPIIADVLARLAAILD